MMNDYVDRLFDIKGKTAIVTGGKKGIGFEIANTLYKAGCNLVIIDTLPEEKVLVNFDNKRVKYLQYDLSVTDNIDESFDDAIQFLGSLDIIINNAGINKRFFAENFPTDTWKEIIEINLNTVFHFCKLAGHLMIKQSSGKIINIASMLSFTGGFTASAYSASKGGVAQLTKSLANEWANKGINVNALAPGFMLTDLNKDILKDKTRYNDILSRIPTNRWGNTEDLSGSILFLSSKASDYVNGIILPVDGGYLSR
tara:strand:- start:3617 stop:4381 length:765 start_codon:yes stop_codon:yes gene_type:complete